MTTFVVAGLLVCFVLAMMASERFRSVSNELWGHYVVNLLRVGWPYALIFAVYDVISNGSLGNTLKIMLSSNH